MKRILLLMVTIVLLTAITAYTQDNQVDKTTVPFTNPNKPGLVMANVFHGSIIVTGYSGKEVIVEARTRTKKLSEESKIEERENRRAEERLRRSRSKVNEKAKGMKKITVNTTGLRIEEQDNVMRIRTQSMKRSVDLTIKVPYSTSLKLDGHTDGYFKIENVSGEFDVERHSGAITMLNISGTVVASTHSGEILVTFKKVSPDKPMSFATFSRDIDVTFPANLKCGIKLKSDRADIFSDFDVVPVRQRSKQVKDSRKEGGKYRIDFDKNIYGKINGGGPEISFKTYSGNIYIRKNK